MTCFQPALDLLHSYRDFFSTDRPVTLARAPGRLDVMGGIADYSGARVLELPLSCATFALVQPQDAPRCDIASHRGDRWDRHASDMPLAPAAELAEWARAHAADRWASYVLGVVQALVPTRATGLRILIESSVPEGRGVASSAALEVATATAVAASCGVRIRPAELAALCQRVENEVVGAPCGIMDQMTSACGKQDRLLRLLCQPGTIEGYVEVPPGYRFYGIDSGVSHAVAGAAYGTVRTAAFMGLKILNRTTAWRGQFLANLTPADFKSVERRLPETMTGEEFRIEYGAITDTATSVVGARRYPVRRAVAHPVHEHARVERFAQLLPELARRPSAARELGQLMFASHQSYSACGLGSEATDRLVELVRAAGPARGLFGAKITGGGSGGTVAVFGTSDAQDAVRDIAQRYQAETTRVARVFSDSGPGAAELGVLQVTPAM